MKALTIPELALVVLIGPSGCGKSTFARTHFAPTEVVSSDACRGMLADNENDQTVTTDAFDLLHTIARKRLALGRLTVVDATNVQPESRKPLLQIARDYHTLAVAIVFDVPASVCHARNAVRPDRNFGSHVVGQQRAQMRRGLRGLQREGFRYVHTLRSVEDIAAVRIERQRLWVDRRDDHGPFDIIGDVHGCFSELSLLLHELGYTVAAEELADGDHRYAVTHPAGRRVIFLGDLVDRGPASPDVLRLAMDMAASGAALCVPGNHDDRLKRKLWGKNVRITHGLAETLAQLEHEPAGFTTRVEQFLDGLVGHYVLAGGDLVVAHAGMKQELQGRASGTVRQFALYGETTGETDEYGLPVRHNWAAEYRGTATVVYGH
ncbi:MAG: AAA family ATPase, partial [Planctomycetota bacterium]